MNLRRVADVGDPRNAPGTERDPLHDHIAKSKFYFVNSKELILNGLRSYESSMTVDNDGPIVWPRVSVESANHFHPDSPYCFARVFI